MTRDEATADDADQTKTEEIEIRIESVFGFIRVIRVLGSRVIRVPVFTTYSPFRSTVGRLAFTAGSRGER